MKASNWHITKVGKVRELSHAVVGGQGWAQRDAPPESIKLSFMDNTNKPGEVESVDIYLTDAELDRLVLAIKDYKRVKKHDPFHSAVEFVESDTMAAKELPK